MRRVWENPIFFLFFSNRRLYVKIIYVYSILSFTCRVHLHCSHFCGRVYHPKGYVFDLFAQGDENSTHFMSSIEAFLWIMMSIYWDSRCVVFFIILWFLTFISFPFYLFLTFLLFMWFYYCFFFLFYLCMLLRSPCVFIILDVKLVLCLLFVKIDRIRGHNFLCTEEKEVTTHLVALVPSLADSARGMGFSQIFGR